MTCAAALQGVVLAGPTASGKSALALELAARLPLEIVSVDSALVYRGMDIGTAKPTPAERADVPHHLIDILDPTEAYSAARFAADATALAADIRARGRLPLLVGGTMLYVKALREGLHELPPADAAVRAMLDAEAAERGWPALHAELARVDPATATRLPPLDAQRIQRALEVWHISGRPLSAWHAQARPAAIDTDAAWPVISLEPRQRAWLHERIARRLAQMFEAGFVWPRCARCGRAATCTPACPRCAAWATARSGRAWTRGLSTRHTARAAAPRPRPSRRRLWPPRASWPSDS